MLMCFFEMGPSPLNQNFFVCVCFSGFIFFLYLLQRAHLLDNTEKLERSSRRLEAGYQIAVETGTYSVLDWVGKKWGGVGRGFKIVVRMSERQQIVLLICEVGGNVCLGVCVWGG